MYSEATVRRCYSKHLCQRDSGTGFPVNFANFLRTLFFTEHFPWLLLYIMDSLKEKDLLVANVIQKAFLSIILFL